MSEQTAAPGPTAAPDVPPHRYTAALAHEIETSWQERWRREGTFRAPNPVGALSEGFADVADLAPLYVADMFPYPSGQGLHVGHPLGYIGTDVFSRYHRMAGRNVLHTMGFDAFGLPAEQYAVQTGQHPRVTTETNIEAISAQLQRMGMDHDTRRSFATIDPDYYRWTQWIFLQIFNSWYDTEADRARPIDQLIAELDAGSREPADGANPFGRRWTELSPAQRRQVVDGHRLAYISDAPVNWCPGLGTVLSNEEVTPDGRSERGNFPVFRRPLRQWMLRITAYADRLADDLGTVQWPESVKVMQRNWIGRSVGARIWFGTDGEPIEVFTTRPDTLFGATYVVLAPEHPLVDQLVPAAWPDGVPESWTGGAATPVAAVSAYRRATSRRTDLERQTEGRQKTGVFTGGYATNPATGSQLPVFVADYVLMGYGTGAIMAVPAQDERDWEFAAVYGLPLVRTVQPPTGWTGEAYTGEGTAINSANDEIRLDGLGVTEAKERIVTWLADKGAGTGAVTYRLRDWLFSRQRYWGEPFPIVYPVDGKDAGMPMAVPETMLPVTLPEVEDYSPKTFADDDQTSSPEPPLSRASEWVEVELDLGDGPRRYRRETNTMPNWAGSCWYELRYVDPHNRDAFVDPVNEAYWMGPGAHGKTGGVDLYVGGVEHAVLHLLYARFWHKVLHDLGHISSSEPFHRYVSQGMIQAPAYTDDRGFYVDTHSVIERDSAFFDADGQPVRREFGKIGKSLKNMITPDEIIDAYGADTFRLYEMFTGPLEQSRPWEPRAVVGMFRLVQRIWRVVVDEQTGAARVSDVDSDAETLHVLHTSIASVREGIQRLRFNISIARITELTNHLTSSYADRPVPRAAAEGLVLLVAPLAPHVADELWSRLGHDESLARGPFPVADPAYLTTATVPVPVQVNGKVRDVIEVPAGADAAALEVAARASAKVADALAGKHVRRVIAVPARLVNFVVG